MHLASRQGPGVSHGDVSCACGEALLCVPMPHDHQSLGLARAQPGLRGAGWEPASQRGSCPGFNGVEAVWTQQSHRSLEDVSLGLGSLEDNCCWLRCPQGFSPPAQLAAGGRLCEPCRRSVLCAALLSRHCPVCGLGPLIPSNGEETGRRLQPWLQLGVNCGPNQHGEVGSRQARHPVAPCARHSAPPDFRFQVTPRGHQRRGRSVCGDGPWKV